MILLQLIVMIGLDIVYCVTGGKAMQYVFDVSPLHPTLLRQPG